MIERLIQLSHQRAIWVLLIVFGVVLEAAALYYQYILEELPCVLCIHVRMWLAVIILIGIAGLLSSSIASKARAIYFNRFWHVLNVGAAIGFLERCYRVLAVERGWTLDSCGMGLGLPSWLSWLEVDVWMPWLFEALGSCGYTPNVFGLTMAEALIIIAVGFFLLSCFLMILSWRGGVSESHTSEV